MPSLSMIVDQKPKSGRKWTIDSFIIAVSKIEAPPNRGTQTIYDSIIVLPLLMMLLLYYIYLEKLSSIFDF